METQAILRGVRLSAQKGRLVADMIRGKPVEQALNVLTFSPKKAAKIVKKVLESAIRNIPCVRSARLALRAGAVSARPFVVLP